MKNKTMLERDIYFCSQIPIPPKCEAKLGSDFNDRMILLISLQNLFLGSKFLKSELFWVAKIGLIINIFLQF